MINLLNVDCMDYLRTLGDKAFELAIVDPPYGLSKKSWHGSGKLKKRIFNTSAGKGTRWDAPPPQEFFDELFRVSANQIIFGGNYFNLPPVRGIIAWDKCQPWENFSQFELAWTSFDRPARLFRHRNNGVKKIHPTQKPVELYKWLLSKYAVDGDRILDTHLGSGSIALACHELGFDLTGCEIDKSYYDGARARLEHFKQQRLMDFGGGT